MEGETLNLLLPRKLRSGAICCHDKEAKGLRSRRTFTYWLKRPGDRSREKRSVARAKEMGSISEPLGGDNSNKLSCCSSVRMLPDEGKEVT